MYYGQNRNGINWVNGTEGAKAYQLLPNTNTMLLDSDNNGIFYIKTCDNVGMCTLRTFKYEEITSTPKADVDLSAYVTREELKSLLEEIKNERVIQPTKPEYKPTEYKYPGNNK